MYTLHVASSLFIWLRMYVVFTQSAYSMYIHMHIHTQVLSHSQTHTQGDMHIHTQVLSHSQTHTQGDMHIHTQVLSHSQTHTQGDIYIIMPMVPCMFMTMFLQTTQSTIWGVRHLPQNREVFGTVGGGSLHLWK